ncbi:MULTISPECIES: serine/threonine-protein kinase [unclassified Nostoc]|uniref:serine/threonine-protein kinase n=1 Tax=unclassified Nostoc TaxID=2593658 RepID=UPI002AD4B128|nr:serine/threonine-protein kinase [Nostoc sp. DedQUE03]MDZ7974588.1 serine/threonine-protein kinase [Nostoc sp. DedQUE03]MDZ8047007.1 serine/threonine-protein kinase [Nostoc sp. DedQUE02]
MICCLNPDCSNPLNPNGKKFCQSCSTPLVSLLRNRFRVIRVLSDEGGFGRTYLSEDVDKLNERCVIKQLAPKFQGTWSQKKAMELFAEEAQRLQDLGEHPQIPTLIAYFEQDGCLYLVQQFINGENLLKELEQRKSYNAREIQSILLDLLPILKFIHDRKVIHRDIKPENIIRHKSDGRLSLIDFGSSKQFTAKVQQKSGTSIGSHGYSPLEQIRDGKAFPASDLFGVGATCFHLLTGNSPFQLWMESGYAWVNNWREYLRSPLNPELDFVIDKLLKKDIHERYQSADEVLRDLTPKQLLALPPAGKSSGKIPPTRAPSLPKSYPLLRILILISALIMLFGFGESWYKHFRQIQTSLVSRLSQHNSSGKDEALLSQPLKITLGKVSLTNTLQAHENSVLSVAISPDGKTIASSGDDRTIKLWNLATGKPISSLKGHFQRVNVVVISPDGKLLVSASDDNTIKIWNLATRKQIRTLMGHSDSVHALAISADSETLVTGSDDNTIKIWDLATGEQIRTLAGHTFWVRSVAISPDGVILASGSFDKTIKIWNLTKGYPIRTLEGNSQTVTTVAISPDGKTLASGGRDRTIKLWNLATGREIRTLSGHGNTITTVAFSTDGKILASGSRDRTIKLWNLATGEEILTLTGHTNTVTSVAFSPDGKTLVSGSEDNTIKVWRLFQ